MMLMAYKIKEILETGKMEKNMQEKKRHWGFCRDSMMPENPKALSCF